MKTIIALSIFATSAFASAEKLVDCKVTDILNGEYYEESLSVEEYPDVVVEKTQDGLTVSVGGTRDYEEANGDRIEVGPFSRKYREYKAAYKEDEFQSPVTISIENKQRTIRKNGKVTKFRVGELYKDGELVAELRCE